jgi:hypothetical protein
VTTPEERREVPTLLIGGALHGQEINALPDLAEYPSSAGRYLRRTVRFVARDPRNIHSAALRTYWTCDVMAHEHIADEPAALYGWWQSLADVRLFAAYGHDVTNDPAERERFRPVERAPSDG